MRLFACDVCSNTVHFDNTACLGCGRGLGWVAELDRPTATEVEGERLVSPALGRAFAACANAARDGCNWLVPIERAGEACPACRHDRSLPDLSEPRAAAAYRRIAAARRHLMRALLALGLRPATRAEDPAGGLAFDFLADGVGPSGEPLPAMTGHAGGVITLALAEADDAEREARRTALGEPERTLLGHFRHEIGHYWWDRLVADREGTEAFRALFGDERADYGEALARHYRDGAPPDWPLAHVSAYAACHPWEDFAETWAHWMTMVDTLETAHAFGLGLAPHGAGGDLAVALDFDPAHPVPFARLAEAWPSLTVALNALSASLGRRDLCPVVLGPTTFAKLAFVDGLVRGAM